eukprot:3590503-Rhodomonas_salina.1
MQYPCQSPCQPRPTSSTPPIPTPVLSSQLRYHHRHVRTGHDTATALSSSLRCEQNDPLRTCPCSHGRGGRSPFLAGGFWSPLSSRAIIARFEGTCCCGLAPESCRIPRSDSCLKGSGARKNGEHHHDTANSIGSRMLNHAGGAAGLRTLEYPGTPGGGDTGRKGVFAVRGRFGRFVRYAFAGYRRLEPLPKVKHWCN